jgi:hypothetical protein
LADRVVVRFGLARARDDVPTVALEMAPSFAVAMTRVEPDPNIEGPSEMSGDSMAGHNADHGYNLPQGAARRASGPSAPGSVYSRGGDGE